jgi:hypothetical protein
LLLVGGQQLLLLLAAAAQSPSLNSTPAQQLVLLVPWYCRFPLVRVLLWC